METSDQVTYLNGDWVAVVGKDGNKIENIREILLHALVVIFKDVNFKTPEELIKFISPFATAVPQYPYNEVVIKMGPKSSLDSHSELHWHNDGSFKATPFTFGSLYCEDIDEGASPTYWINMVQAYEELDEDIKEQIKDMKAAHSLQYHIDTHLGPYIFEFRNEREARVSLKRAVWKHDLVKITGGRKALFFSDYVDESSMDKKLFDIIREHCYSEKYMFHHQWSKGEYGMFSNYGTIHKRGETPAHITRKLWKTQSI